jgi:predicted transcriptional regulator
MKVTVDLDAEAFAALQRLARSRGDADCAAVLRDAVREYLHAHEGAADDGYDRRLRDITSLLESFSAEEGEHMEHALRELRQSWR